MIITDIHEGINICLYMTLRNKILSVSEQPGERTCEKKKIKLKCESGSL